MSEANVLTKKDFATDQEIRWCPGCGLGTTSTVSLPHEQIIRRLEEAGRSFQVLVLKTDLTLPYSSVFIELECGYWTDEAEHALRDALARAAAGAK